MAYGVSVLLHWKSLQSFPVLSLSTISESHETISNPRAEPLSLALDLGYGTCMCPDTLVPLCPLTVTPQTNLTHPQSQTQQSTPFSRRHLRG